MKGGRVAPVNKGIWNFFVPEELPLGCEYNQVFQEDDAEVCRSLGEDLWGAKERDRQERADGEAAGWVETGSTEEVDVHDLEEEEPRGFSSLSHAESRGPPLGRRGDNRMNKMNKVLIHQFAPSLCEAEQDLSTAEPKQLYREPKQENLEDTGHVAGAEWANGSAEEEKEEKPGLEPQRSFTESYSWRWKNGEISAKPPETGAQGCPENQEGGSVPCVEGVEDFSDTDEEEDLNSQGQSASEADEKALSQMAGATE
ncbi:hypothetical protein JRQ81_012150 [Phrynocephalus forsythii]|uniref:Uncharacterized protein n=1 Tax=Phrynocephalus forsythii TaxID=171643 RepID=A0A9Q0X5P6_9SAUR|nr:hypothetical protein JRQ81_012150 [Phrynocephalus forsythii]